MSFSYTDIDSIAWDQASGLVPAVVQHARTGAVLMLGYMNREAVRATLERSRVVFFSRSKQRLWEKGETSGNTLQYLDASLDCDHDTLLISALPTGPVCHTGTSTCFGDAARSEAEGLAFLGELERVIARRVQETPEGSYTARLYARGVKHIAQKVGEEGVEVALAGVNEPDAQLLGESADLLYHLLVLLKVRGLTTAQVMAELRSRHAARSTS
jgi:phosphoribosyl-ATP pyrophosphohydrolase/phosphoribosyl-AMP cyclohydrolase